MANEFKVKKGLIVQGSGSTLLDIQGSQGQLFSVTDTLSGSLFSVNDISGMPIMEVFSNDRVLLGTFNAEAIRVSGSIANITGSLFGTASYATQALSASWAPPSTSAATASFVTSSNVYGPNGSNSILSSSFATNANSASVTDTTTGVGPYYLMFADGTSGNRVVRVDSSTLQFNATTNTLTVPNLAGTASLATTASFALTASGIGPAIIGNTNNNVLTATGGSTIQGESNLTFDGGTLVLNGNLRQGTTANTTPGGGAHAEGNTTVAQGDGSHAEGNLTLAAGLASHTEGRLTTSSGNYSHAEGESTRTIGQSSHAEGVNTIASGSYSHAEGDLTVAKGTSSHAEGGSTVASGSWSHAEGKLTVASGSYAHAEGSETLAIGQFSHAEGLGTLATGVASHAAGLYTTASGDYQSVIGQYNLPSTTPSAFIIGNGTGTGASRSNLVFASGSQFQITGSLNVNGNTIITGSAVIGSSSLGASENTLTLGARDASSEGGQIGFNAPGGTYTSASFIDNWQNKARILKGNNTTSTGLIAQWDIHTTQMQLAGYTAASSFPGTATANLAVDSGGNVITVSTSGGSVFPYTGTAGVTGSISATGPIYSQVNGGMYFQGGDDAALYDINIANHMGIYGVQDSTVGAIKLGSAGPVLYGSGSRLGIGTTNPSSASLTVNGNVWATSFTGSLFGTSSWAVSASVAVSSSRAVTSSFAISALTASVAEAVATSGAGSGTWYPLMQSGFSSGYKTPAYISTLSFNGTTGVLNTTASVAVTASFASTASFLNGGSTNAFVQNGNSFGTTALLGTNDNQPLAFETNATERMRIDSTGNVGIGTTSPQRKLDVLSGANNFVSVGIDTMAVSQWAGVHFGYGEGANNLYRKSAIVFERTDLTANNAQGKIHILNGPQGNANSATLADSKLTINEAGDVGIGTTSPTSLGGNVKTLDIRDSGGGGVRSGVAGGSESTFYTIAAGGYLGTISNIPLNLQTNNSVKATILANGNIGINTSAPETKLHIEDVTKVLTGNVAGVAQGTLSLVSTDAQAADIGASLVFGGNYINSSNTRIAYAGITGRKSNSSSVNADGYLSFLTWRSTGLTEAMRITAAGSVGINTTSPTLGTLQVNGNVHATSYTGSLLGTASYATAAGTVTVTNQDTTPVTYNITFAGGSSGNHSLAVDTTTLTYTPSTSTFATPRISATSITASLFGTASWAVSASWAPGGGGSSITVQDEGSTLTSALTSLNFVGSGVAATNSGGAVTVTIAGAGGSAFPYTGSAEITGSLRVTGSITSTKDATINSVIVGRGGTSTSATNVALGAGTADSLSTGTTQTAIGSEALYTNATSANNTAVGRRAGYSITGEGNTIIGAGLDKQPEDSSFTGAYTLSIGKQSTDTNDLPHFWAPETVVVNDSTNTNVLRIAPSKYSGFFLDYVIDNVSGIMRSGTIKGVFLSDMSIIKSTEVDVLAIGDSSLAKFTVVDNGSSAIEVRLNNTTGNTMYCNFTSRLILRVL